MSERERERKAKWNLKRGRGNANKGYDLPFVISALTLSLLDPRPDHNCIPTATGSVWLEAIKISFGRTYTCSDCMFSGHTAAVTLLVMFWSNYSRGEEFAVCFGQHQGIITSNVDAAGDPVGFKIIDLFLYAWALNMYYWSDRMRWPTLSDGDDWHHSQCFCVCASLCVSSCVCRIIATRYHYSSDVFIGFVVTWLLFHTYHLYIKSLAMQGGSLLARGMRWFEGINIATEKAIEAAAEAEATGDAQQSKPTDGTIIALRAGKEMTKENATIGGDHVPVAALPVSYLEGNNYYRAGVDTDKASLSHKDSALYDNDDVGPLPSFGVPDSAIAAARAGGPFERNTSLRRSDDDARAYTQPTPITNQAHNTDLPVAVIVTGEHAEQEQREKAREKAGEM